MELLRDRRPSWLPWAAASGLAADIYRLGDARARRDLCHSVMPSSGTAAWIGALRSTPSRGMTPSDAGI